MWQWRDPALFTDSLTATLRESARYPDGYQALFRLATRLTSPIAFGEWLGVGLMAASGWLVFLIVREHTAWRPAAWIAAAIFLSLVDIHRFSGGFPRGFVHPVVLLVVLLAMRRRDVPAAAIAAAAAFVYPTAALLAAGVLGVSALRTRRPWIDVRRAALAALALAATAAVTLGAGGAGAVLSASQARDYDEFGPNGALNFFVPSVVEYLRQNRSGFDLQASGSALLLAALLLLVAARGRARLRPEVLALPVVALLGWAAAQLVLFQLYLPHRFTYPLVAFGAIAVGVLLEPAWAAVPRRRLLAAPALIFAVAVFWFPLGPTRPLAALPLGLAGAGIVLAVAVAPRLRATAAGAAALGAAILVAVAGANEHWKRGSPCARYAATAFLSTLPKDAVIAGDPMDLKCLPATTRRAVVISTQLAPSYETEYFMQGRERMFATLRAVYGPSPRALAVLQERFGATHLWIRRDAVRKVVRTGGGRWRRGNEPYGTFIARLVSGAGPASLHLPAGCRRWRAGMSEVYDIACVAATAPGR
jgi:hypothetical protein